jgi:hypothetical protein
MFTESTIRALQDTWNIVSADAGSCSTLQAAELTLDRLYGNEADIEVTALIKVHGYKKVEIACSRILQGS